MKTLAPSPHWQQGHGAQAFANALSVAEANACLARMVEPIAATEEVGVFEALGRVLAHDVVSPINVPAHDNSAMDGYAFKGSQLEAGQPLTLRVAGTARAGHAWPHQAEPGDCVKIMTGAPMPAGLDTVVPQECVLSAHGGESITIASGVVRSGDHRRRQGEDLMQGGVAIAKGTLLTPAALGLVASLGLRTVTVRRRLRVAYFSSGDEILSLGEVPREGAVYDSNRYTVFGLLTRLGVEVIDLGVVRDDPALLETAFREAALRADAIITSGGVSEGEADHLRNVVQRLGEVDFWRIAIRPGRPMAVGRIGMDLQSDAGWLNVAHAASAHQGATVRSGGAMLFGLPGNPVAVMVTFLALVRPALLRMMGCHYTQPPLLRAVSTEIMRKKPGRTEYQRGVVSTSADGTLQVRTTGPQGSGVLSSMAQANGLIVLGHDQGSVEIGEAVDVIMFDGVI